MSDDRLRELERRFHMEGTVEAEAAWIGVRAQAGELPRERLRLAAFLGHPAARVAIGSPPQQPTELWEWAIALASFGSEVSARACIAAAWAIVPFWEQTGRSGGVFNPARILCKLEQQLLGAALPSTHVAAAKDIRAMAEPTAPLLSMPGLGSLPDIVRFLNAASPLASPETLGECLRLGLPEVEEALAEEAELTLCSRRWLAERGIETLEELAAVTSAELDQDSHLTDAARSELRTFLSDRGYAPGSNVDEEDLEVPLPGFNPFFRRGGVRAAIGEELVPWALRDSDPLGDRVRARQESGA